MLPTRFVSYDAVELELVTTTELLEFGKLAIRDARPAQLRGSVDSSLEDEHSVIHYRLLDGNQVAGLIPRLQHLYENEFKQLAENAFDLRLTSSPQQVNGVNVNVLEGNGGRYEWHVDTNPITGLLVMSRCDAETGGRLVFGRDPASQTVLPLRLGQLLFFDARKSPHAVEALRVQLPRATAPMNYFLDGEPVSRPEDLDDALYGSTG